MLELSQDSLLLFLDNLIWVIYSSEDCSYTSSVDLVYLHWFSSYSLEKCRYGKCKAQQEEESIWENISLLTASIIVWAVNDTKGCAN